MKLYIIGNGFDRNHGLNTSYFDYRNYLLNKGVRISDFENDENLPNPVGEYWACIESHLQINYEDLFDNSFNVFASNLNDESDSRWHNLVVEIELRTELSNKITDEYFKEWINSIDDNCNKKYDFGNDCIFVTFNYTHILEKAYGVKPLHIHGEKHGSIQFGCFDNNPKEITKELSRRYEDYEWYCVSVEPAIHELKIYCNNSFKDFERNKKLLKEYLSDKNIDEVIVMGHSFLGIDECYYRDVFTKYKCKWTIFSHSPYDCEKIKEFEKRYNIKVKTRKW